MNHSSDGLTRIGRPALALRGAVQRYAWGKVGAASRIAPIIRSYGVDEPLAEYWIGSHPKAPSGVLFGEGETLPLPEALRRYPEKLLGARVAQRFNNDLPFLLKVLSINPAFGLSIQAHPDKDLAARLHARDPLTYPDSMHKPEIALPLTPVTLLYGFRSIPAIRDIFATYSELGKLLGGSLFSEISQFAVKEDLFSKGSEFVDAERSLLKRIYSYVLRLTPSQVEGAVRTLKSRLNCVGNRPLELEILDRLSKQYGDGDVGLLALFFMNISVIKPGEALFIGPNIPHAYLDGDLVECMACSDNVVRAGLTPKFKDVETLLEMLDYSARMPRVITPMLLPDGSQVMSAPVEEFEVRVFPAGNSDVEIRSTAGVQIVLVLDGSTPTVVATLVGIDSGGVLELQDGGAALIPPNSGAYRVERSHAALYVVSVGVV